jgi:hypothetical protein
MLFNNAVFVGIDPTAKGRPLTYAALDEDLQVIALKKADPRDVLAFLGSLNRAFVGVNAPQRPNQGLMKQEEIRQQLNPVPNPGSWTNFRVAEYQLFQHNIRIPHTDRDVEDCPSWMQGGFEIYKHLTEFGYHAYPEEDCPQQYLEVYPYAAYAVLLKRLPFPKKTLEGRLQRQVLLYSRSVEVPNAMRVFEEITRYRLLQGILPLERLHSAEELDALVAAYTAWLAAAEPDQMTLVGDPREGQIVLPCPVLEPKY